MAGYQHNMLQWAHLGALQHGGDGNFGCEEFGTLWRTGRGGESNQNTPIQTLFLAM